MNTTQSERAPWHDPNCTCYVNPGGLDGVMVAIDCPVHGARPEQQDDRQFESVAAALAEWSRPDSFAERGIGSRLHWCRVARIVCTDRDVADLVQRKVEAEKDALRRRLAPRDAQ